MAQEIVKDENGGYHYESVCYNCGKVGISTIGANHPTMNHDDLTMTQITYGKHRGQFRCKSYKRSGKC